MFFYSLDFSLSLSLNYFQRVYTLLLLNLKIHEGFGVTSPIMGSRDVCNIGRDLVSAYILETTCGV